MIDRLKRLRNKDRLSAFAIAAKVSRRTLQRVMLGKKHNDGTKELIRAALAKPMWRKS